MEGGDILEPLRDRIVGRISQEDIYDPLTGDRLVAQNEELSEELANAIQEADIEQVKIRSVLTSETRRGVCRRCYGRNLASASWSRSARQSVSSPPNPSFAVLRTSPGTQLTMRDPATHAASEAGRRRPAADV